VSNNQKNLLLATFNATIEKTGQGLLELCCSQTASRRKYTPCSRKDGLRSSGKRQL